MIRAEHEGEGIIRDEVESQNSLIEGRAVSASRVGIKPISGALFNMTYLALQDFHIETTIDL